MSANPVRSTSFWLRSVNPGLRIFGIGNLARHYPEILYFMKKQSSDRCLLTLVSILIPILACATTPDEEGWISLFNGENLDGWVVKVTGHETGENPGDL